MMRTKMLLLSAVTLIVFFFGAASAQTPVFTYQGKLSDTGTPPTGTYQMEFRLFDGGGAQIGTVVANNAVSVTEGVFTVNLNFGSTAFPGADRFLQISVRRNAGEGFVTLNPRQQIASSPYSIRTLSAAQADTSLDSNQLGGVPANQYLQTNGNGSGLTNLNASNITTDTLSNERLGQIPTANIADSAVTSAKIAGGQVVKSVNTLRDDVTLAAGTNITITPAGNNTLTIASTGGAGNAILNQTTQQAGANFNISGDGTAGGTLSGNIVNAGVQYNIAGSRILSNPGSFNLFAGVNAGAVNTGVENSFFGLDAGRANTSGSLNSFFGRGAGFSNTMGNGNSFVGAAAGFSNEGSNNSFVGGRAGQMNSIGSNNSFVGSSAGIGNSTGRNNTIIGNNANVIFGNLEFATAIGADAVVASSASIVLGRDSAVNGGDWVGIGVSNPLRKLDVNGRARIRFIPSEPSFAQVCFSQAGDLLQCGGSSLRLKKNTSRRFVTASTS